VDVESVDVCVEGMSEALSRASTLMVELRDQHRFKFLRLDDYHVQELVAMSLLEDLVTKDVDSEGRTLLEVYTAKPLRGRTRSGSADSAGEESRAREGARTKKTKQKRKQKLANPALNSAFAVKYLWARLFPPRPPLFTHVCMYVWTCGRMDLWLTLASLVQR